MKKLCILATVENVEAVRAKAYENIPELTGHKLLNYPVSATGEEPITHWFCPMNGTKKIIEKMKSLQELSIMEVDNPTEFLKSHNLMIVRK